MTVHEQSNETQQEQRELTKVDANYVHFLRVQIVIPVLLLCALLLVLWRWAPSVPSGVSWLGIGLLLTALVLGSLWWAPRRTRVTGYYVAPDLIGFVVGALWHKEVVVPFNRLQHLELQQGPTERMFGLSRLVLYTAGGSGADLAIPGLRTEVAEQIRDNVLGIVRSEQLTDEAITSAPTSEPISVESKDQKDDEAPK